MLLILKSLSRSPALFQRQDNSDLCLPFLSCLFVSAKTPWRNLCYSDRNIGYSGVIQPAYKYLLYYHYHYTTFCNSLYQLHPTSSLHFYLSQHNESILINPPYHRLCKGFNLFETGSLLIIRD